MESNIIYYKSHYYTVKIKFPVEIKCKVEKKGQIIKFGWSSLNIVWQQTTILGNIFISIAPSKPELQAIALTSKKLSRLLLQQKASLKNLAFSKFNF